MPVGIEQWRAGIFCKRAILRVRVFYQIPLGEIWPVPCIPLPTCTQ